VASRLPLFSSLCFRNPVPASKKKKMSPGGELILQKPISHEVDLTLPEVCSFSSSGTSFLMKLMTVSPGSKEESVEIPSESRGRVGTKEKSRETSREIEN
jgi:hypothetical protein